MTMWKSKKQDRALFCGEHPTRSVIPLAPENVRVVLARNRLSIFLPARLAWHDAPPARFSAAVTSPPATLPTVSKRELYLVFAGLMLALTLASLDQNIVSTALPRIVSDLGGLQHLSWVVTAFMVASTTTTPLYGKLSDIYGRKRLFYVAISVFLAGSVLCGLSQTMLQLILFRALQGLGAGGLMTLAQTTIGDIIPPRERGRYQGLFGGVFAACSVAGPLLGGIITDALSWRWIFYVNLPVGAAALALIAIGLKHPNERAEHRIDYPGAALLSAATVSLLLFLSWGGTQFPWTSPAMIVLAAAAVLLFGWTIFQESRAAEPILPPRLFRLRGFVIPVVVIGLQAMALFGSLVYLPLFFQLVMGASPSHAGLLMAPLMAGVIVTSVSGGRLVARTGRYKIFPIIGLLLASGSFLAIGLCAEKAVGVVPLVIALVTLGCGFGFVMPIMTTALQNIVARPDLGTATSVSAFLRSLGGALGVALSGAVVTARLHMLLPPSFNASGLTRLTASFATTNPAAHRLVTEAYRHAIATTFFTGAALAALAFVIVLGLPEQPLRAREKTPVAAE
jgi:EmrB/QacA subfamily drug resistance transporter